jgi:hypothetical protein
MTGVLPNIQVSVVGKAGECDLIVAGYIESELAHAGVRAGRPAIQNFPRFTLLNLMDDLGGANTDVDASEAFLLALMGNYDLVRFLPVANDRAVEVILVQLKEDVVFGVGVVKQPLQEASFDRHRGKDERARRRNGSVQNEVPAFTNERIFLMLPGAWVLPLRHPVRGER